MAHQLGKTYEEILELPIALFIDWMAYFHIKNEEEQKAIKKSSRKKLPKGDGF